MVGIVDGHGGREENEDEGGAVGGLYGTQASTNAINKGTSALWTRCFDSTYVAPNPHLYMSTSLCPSVERLLIGFDADLN
jgi:hypothetical protein